MSQRYERQENLLVTSESVEGPDSNGILRTWPGTVSLWEWQSQDLVTLGGEYPVLCEITLPYPGDKGNPVLEVPSEGNALLPSDTRLPYNMFPSSVTKTNSTSPLTNTSVGTPRIVQSYSKGLSGPSILSGHLLLRPHFSVATRYRGRKPLVTFKLHRPHRPFTRFRLNVSSVMSWSVQVVRIALRLGPG